MEIKHRTYWVLIGNFWRNMYNMFIKSDYLHILIETSTILTYFHLLP